MAQGPQHHHSQLMHRSLRAGEWVVVQNQEVGELSMLECTQLLPWPQTMALFLVAATMTSLGASLAAWNISFSSLVPSLHRQCR